MAKRLVQVAKELNVGTATIVEFLTNNGFEIENKPTAKISEEMEVKLLKEYQKSIAIKEKADSLVIGTRPAAKKEGGKDETHASVMHPPATTHKEESEPAEKPKKQEAEHQEAVVEKPRLQLRIQGKVDLDTLNKPKRKKNRPNRSRLPKNRPRRPKNRQKPLPLKHPKLPKNPKNLLKKKKKKLLSSRNL